MNWEFNFLYFLQKLHNPILDKLMVFITCSGNYAFIWVFISAAFLLEEKYKECGISILISLIIVSILGNLMLKNIFKRSRPCWKDKSIQLLIKNPSDYSFPSGHTYSSITAALIMFLYFPQIGIYALIFALLIAFSRMYLFVHFPTDILSSCILGILTSSFTFLIVKKIIMIL